MKRKNLYGTGNDTFECLVCDAKVQKLHDGGYRNHCNICLFSRHVDVIPGDRRSRCLGMMRPTKVSSSRKKGWVIRYNCSKCGYCGNNKAAADDDFDILCRLS